VVLLLSGCGSVSTVLPYGDTASPAPAIAQGRALGGQQPISGANVVLYAVNTTTTGGASHSLMTSSVTTNSAGFFTLTGNYSCTGYTSTPVYLLVSGGNAGAGTNSAINLIAAIGNCSTLTSSSFISVNELTTVAAVYALSAYMTSPTAIGSTSSLSSAFTLAAEYANVATGSSPNPSSLPPTGYIVPTIQIYTIADAIFACVNSAGPSSTPCSNLFSYTTVGSTPSNVATATLNMANNPTTISASNVFSLVTAQAPYQPALTVAPANLNVALLAAASNYVLATGDSRRISQPTVPAVCQKLTAQAYSGSITRSAPPSSGSDDTTSIQSALTSCANTGKAVELAANGSYVAYYTESLTVTGETLLIDSGVTLYGNTYNTSSNPLLTITGTNTGLMGPGTLDGRGDILSNAHSNRLVQATNNYNLVVYNVTLTQSIYPNLYIQGGDGVTVWGVTIQTPGTRANADGIDIDSISDVTVINSSVEDGDDGIAVKSNNSSTYNITVQNSKFYASHGLSIGSVTGNTISNILFTGNMVNSYGVTFPGANAGTANAINIKTDNPCSLVVQQVSYLNTCIINAKHLITFTQNYSTCGSGSEPIMDDIIVNGAYSTQSQSGAYEYFNGVSGGTTVAYLANISLDTLSINSSYPNQYGTYYLYNTNGLYPTPDGTTATNNTNGITYSSFTPPSGSVPTCTFN
jgi:polygalacturonase